MYLTYLTVTRPQDSALGKVEHAKKIAKQLEWGGFNFCIKF